MDDPSSDFREAVRAGLGYAPETIEPGRFQRFGTRERRGDTAGWSKLFDDMRGGVFGCYRQGISETWSAIDRATMTRRERAELVRQVMIAAAERNVEQRRQWAENAQRIAQLWNRCVVLTAGDPVSLYLCRRMALDTFDPPSCLRLHPALDYFHEGERIGTYPAMVAPLTAPDGRVVALHRTYLTDDGHKADVSGTEKKLTCTAGPLAGASIRLHQPVGGVIGVAEGVETALAASLASGVPTVAAYCAGALAGYQWPAGVQRLVIFADADRAGREAADELKARAQRAWLSVNVMTPSADGADWCDVWAARGAVVLEAAA